MYLIRKHSEFISRLMGSLLPAAFAAGSLLAAAGCGGATSTTAPSTETAARGTAATETGGISGSAYKGPVSGGTVTAYAVSNGAQGAQLASAMTDAQGNFTMKMSGYSGPVMLSMSGGTYTDEATGSMMSMASGDMMTTMIPSISSGSSVSNVMMTPLTSMAQTMAANMPGGMTPVNMTAAIADMGRYFMVGDILHTMPMDPTVSGSGAGASQDMRNYGMSIAAMSQSAMNLGMTSSSGMVTAMMNDASDGMMNGMMMGGKQVQMGGGPGMMGGPKMMQAGAGASGMASAMTQFMDSSMNRSGLSATDMRALINQLNSASGAIR